MLPRRKCRHQWRKSQSSVAAIGFSTPSAHLRVMWPRAMMTHTVMDGSIEEATARQLFFLTPARGFPTFLTLHGSQEGKLDSVDMEIRSIDRKELPRPSKVGPLQQPRRSWHGWHIPAQRMVCGVLLSNREREMGALRPVGVN